MKKMEEDKIRDTSLSVPSLKFSSTKAENTEAVRHGMAAPHRRKAVGPPRRRRAHPEPSHARPQTA
jgi:hypothetical protein